MWPVAFEQSLHEALKGQDKIFHAFKTYANWHITDDARNMFVCTALKEDFDFIFFMDVDMVFPRACLAFMLRHMAQLPTEQPPILGGVYCSRSDDHRWHVYQKKDDLWQSMKFPLYSGFVEADVIGTGCMLLDVNVFKVIKMPWFEYKYVNVDRKKLTYDRMSEDFVFCEKVKKAGIPLFVDTDILCGHMQSVQVWPTADGGYEVRTMGGEVY